MKNLLIIAALLGGAGAQAQTANANYPNLLGTFLGKIFWKWEDSLGATKPIVLITNGLTPNLTQVTSPSHRPYRVFADSLAAVNHGFLPGEHTFVYLEGVDLHPRLRYAKIRARRGQEQVTVRLLNELKPGYAAQWDAHSIKRYRNGKLVGWEWYLRPEARPAHPGEAQVVALHGVYWGPNFGQ
ncbi:MAG: hypothetical protein MUC97_11330 [Bernardetiaceae bacterium]|jgi:hypothetical protein|nr:hypothetical protein [Bernardetiaceae bacterium]